ncbi:hypothetical protein [Oceanobacter kriegii]|uniref:hypothetical protein n=1 Tax=Oceanobacter kriegii TaxID=64972 RepID=UPI00041ABDD1|nr:hypothetical protein [Oceanobacter kriegii]
MSATLLKFPTPQTSAQDAAGPLASARFEAETCRLELLEHRIRSEQNETRLAMWIDSYLDMGLELASHAALNKLPCLQESWLRRMYNLLRDAAFLNHSRAVNRTLCLENLYQPYFALRHLYSAQPDRRACLKNLSRDMAVTAQYLF